jgi:hypothetical protein
VFTARYGLNLFIQSTVLLVYKVIMSHTTKRSSSCLTCTAQVPKCMHITLRSAHSNTALPRMRELLYSSNKVKFLSLSACSDRERKPNLHKFRMGRARGGGVFLKLYCMHVPVFMRCAEVYWGVRGL